MKYFYAVDGNVKRCNHSDIVKEKAALYTKLLTSIVLLFVALEIIESNKCF